MKLKLFLGAFLFQSVFFFAMYKYFQQNNANLVSPPEIVQPSKEFHVDSMLALNPSEYEFTLVEFGDYECPPCARQVVPVKELLAKYPDRLNFQFRHYPLSSHKEAKKIAVLAEQIRPSGKFYQFHEGLYAKQAEVSDRSIDRLLRDLKIDVHKYSGELENAKIRIEKDMKTASSMRVNSTPTFFLVNINGEVVKLNTLSQAESFIR